SRAATGTRPTRTAIVPMRAIGRGYGFTRLHRLVREAKDVEAVAVTDNHGGDEAHLDHGVAPARPASLSSAPCELCGAAVGAVHRHIYESTSARILCVCRACTILFDRSEAGGGHYRLIPERVVELS